MSTKKESIVFMGGAQEIGRSSIALHSNLYNLFFDSGIKIINDGGMIKQETPLEMLKPDAIILSHSHLDHSGNIPYLKKNFEMKLIMTPPTLDTSEFLWQNFSRYVRLMKSDLYYDNTLIQKIKNSTHEIKINDSITFFDKKLQFFNSSHALGSIMTRVVSPSFSLLYTGDFGCRTTRLNDQPSFKFPKTDYVIMEAVYGKKKDVLPSIASMHKKFANEIKETINNNGKVLIATNPLGRAQEVILTLLSHIKSGNIPDIPIYIDRIIKEINWFYKLFWEWLKDDFGRQLRYSRMNPFDDPLIRTIRNFKEGLNPKRPSIIVASEGNLLGNPINQYLHKLASNENNLIILTEFQLKGSLGDLIHKGIRNMVVRYHDGYNIIEDEIELNAKVSLYDFSAHADQPGLINLLNNLKGLKKVFLVHGYKEVMEELAMTIDEKFDVEVEIPENGDEFHL